MGRTHTSWLKENRGLALMEVLVATSILVACLIAFLTTSVRLLKSTSHLEGYYDLDNIIHQAEEELAHAPFDEVFELAKTDAGWGVQILDTEVVYHVLKKENNDEHVLELIGDILKGGVNLGSFGSVKQYQKTPLKPYDST